MLIGVVSDTHGQIEYTRAAVRMLESLDVRLVLHCGDIGSAAIVRLFRAWPTHFVLGNVDQDEKHFEAAIRATGQAFHGRFGQLQIEGRRIALLHGDDEQALRQTIACGQWDLVCHGHTHVARQAREGRTLVLNPGALYRARPHSLAVVELPGLAVTSIAL